MNRVDLKGKGLTEVPKEVFDSPEAVEVLDLSNNDLSDLPDDLAKLKNLRIAFFSNNQFETYPSVLAECPRLSMVSLKENRLVQIDEGALNPDLRWLILSNNALEYLPNDFCQLAQLEKLALAGNRLRELPAGLANLTSLGLARFSANQLTELPRELLNLPNLAWLSFDGNPLVTPPPDDESLPQFEEADFEIEALIGEGASGLIYRARRKSDSLPVAIKFFKGEITSDGRPEDEKANCIFAGMHSNLVKLVGQMTHPTALVFELVTDEFSNVGNPPSIDSCTRDVFSDQQRRTPDIAKKILSQACAALSHLHRKCLAHGDFYAHNLMANADGETRMADFGASTSLAGLSDAERQRVQQIESRALGYLIDDLVASSGLEEEWIMDLKERCLAPGVAQRPTPIQVSEIFTHHCR
ncbi:MAG: leucine-rich repeat-containing protein kinase family protein [Verrucomicrobiota bacterium]